MLHKSYIRKEKSKYSSEKKSIYNKYFCILLTVPCLRLELQYYIISYSVDEIGYFHYLSESVYDE